MSLTTHEPRDVVAQPERMPVPANASDGIMAQILRVASDPSIDLDRMDKLMEMHQRLQKDQAERDFAAAMAMMQGELPLVVQGGRDDHKKISYSRLEDVLTAARPAMQHHGFSISFDIANEQNGVIVTGTLTHSAGHSRSTTRRYPIDTGPGRSAIQALGSSETYARRYVMMSLLNIASDKDDDGLAAMNSAPPPATITEQQAMELREMLESTGADQAAFLKHAKVPRIDTIPAKDFGSLMALLRRKGERR